MSAQIIDTVNVHYVDWPAVILGAVIASAVSLLIGGAVAAWAATMGGRHRDRQTDFSTFWRWS